MRLRDKNDIIEVKEKFESYIFNMIILSNYFFYDDLIFNNNKYVSCDFL